jgi:competence protein ComEC
VGVEILWPPREAGGSDNDASLVVRITLGGVRILVTGDLESAGESALVGRGTDLRAEVLQLGHHGSRSSSTIEFLRAVDPVVTLAPTGTRPVFAYPHPEVFRRVRALPAVLVGQRERDARLSWRGGDVVEIDTGHAIRVYTRGGGGGRD